MRQTNQTYDYSFYNFYDETPKTGSKIGSDALQLQNNFQHGITPHEIHVAWRSTMTF